MAAVAQRMWHGARRSRPALAFSLTLACSELAEGRPAIAGAHARGRGYDWASRRACHTLGSPRLFDAIDALGGQACGLSSSANRRGLRAMGRRASCSVSERAASCCGSARRVVHECAMAVTAHATRVPQNELVATVQQHRRAGPHHDHT